MDRYRKSAVEAFEKAETLVRAWLEEERITRVDVYLNGLGDVGDTRCWLTTDGERKSVHVNRNAGSAINKLCSCARPKRSAPSMTITVAFGTSTPTSITDVDTSKSTS